MSRPFLSAIVTCYYEERSIDEFYRRLRGALEATGRTFEIILVNDGSTDRTFERLRAIHARDADVTALDLFKNAGQACAITAAIERAEGEYYLFLDSDLQLDPEELPLLLREVDAGCDVVSGVRRERHDPLRRRIFSALGNWVIRRMTGPALTDFGCTFKIYRSALVRAHEFGPRRPFSQAYLLRSAGRIREVPVTHHERRYGKSGWTLRKLLALHLEHVLGASEGAFQLASFIAFTIAALTFLRIALAWVVPGSILAAPVTTGLILNALLLATATLLGVVALVGEYVVRLYNQCFGGPRYIVRELLPKRRPAEAAALGEGSRAAAGP